MQAGASLSGNHVVLPVRIAQNPRGDAVPMLETPLLEAVVGRSRLLLSCIAARIVPDDNSGNIGSCS